MTALRHNPLLSSSIPGLVLTVCSSLLYGCLGGAGGGPKVGWQDHDTVTLTVSDDEDQSERGMAGSGADDDQDQDENAADAGAGEGQAEADAATAERRTTSDDSVRCGNGTLDADEICDFAIPAGKDGACPTDCGDDPCAKLDVHGCMTMCITDTTDPKCPQDEQPDAGAP